MFEKDERYKEAVKLQKELASKVIKNNVFDKLTLVAGADVSQQPYDQEGTIYSAVVVLSYPKLEIIEKSHACLKPDFPYIPGLLAFRESPVVIEALNKLENKPDILIVDGHGISHPRGLGIASHIGVITGYPTIGCAKSILVGAPEEKLPETKRSFVPLIYKNEVIGNVVRTKNKVNPVFVSIGHKIDLKTATEIVLNCTTKYRLPEATREAHNHANVIRKKLNV